ncbi:YihY/virulence factor BrkB family protein [Streptomyces sp. H10-C2]|uniref:YihY/virulence factor BrkB family protein n=1 Tax=unclassified Streptomyces TaxID=2593676 RepID=UPI0024B9140A|nr:MULTISPECIES: YihY/virulence factor BrkB family protein [unclassified Streptomyces]MDJ0343016.1 YihY/virulence factor BrkB family protein [Streptomyces sp. PH10-H1]MDJ0371424.1 YihY/virulence factor BrkB family protein [Streptomyces sp. H10-C2]
MTDEQALPTVGPPGRVAAASAPAARRPRVFLAALRDAAVAAWDEDASERAAALTYYAMLALFPTLLVTVSVIGLLGTSTTSDLIGQVSGVVPAASRQLVASTMKDMAQEHSAAWFLAVSGTVGAVWSASSYLAVFRRALHSMYGVSDHRPAWRTAPRIVITALVLLTLLVCSAVTLMATGRLARRAGQLLGMDAAALASWNALKWPLLLCLATVLVLILFRSGPAGFRPLRVMAPGGALAVVLWLLSSVGFALYVSLFGTYNRLYGSLAGTVVFLVWLWVSHIALLTGAHFNAELAKARGIRAAAGTRSDPLCKRVSEAA